jgi:hypothetical protein
MAFLNLGDLQAQKEVYCTEDPSTVDYDVTRMFLISKSIQVYCADGETTDI